MAEWTIPNLAADPGWHGGRSHALVWALELGEPAHRLTDLARRRLGPVLLERYERQPHVTISYAGLMRGPGADGYDPDALVVDLERLRPLLRGPVTVVAQGWDSFPMVPYLGLASDWLHQAHAALPTPGFHGAMTYRPHLTVGQYATRLPLAEACALLAPLPSTGAWQVGEVSLLRYDTDDISGPLTAEGRLDLTSGQFRWSSRSLLRGTANGRDRAERAADSPDVNN